jgi:hypothetical protein
MTEALELCLSQKEGFYFLRHGQTNWNAEGRIQGLRRRRESSLSLLGLWRESATLDAFVKDSPHLFL